MHRYIYMIYIYPITFCFFVFFNRVTAFDSCTKCVSPKYLPNKWLHVEKILLVLVSKFKTQTKGERSGGVSCQLKLLLGSRDRVQTSFFGHNLSLKCGCDLENKAIPSQ